MLFYKGWLETRVRFILCSIVLFVLCAYSVVQRLDNLRVDLVADVGLPLSATMSAKLAPLGMVTGGSNPS